MIKNSILFYVLLSLCAGLSFAQTSVTQVDAAPGEITELNWTTEGLMSTSSNSLSATFGPGLLYHLDSENQIGFRYLSPVSAGDGTNSLAAIYRYFFTEKKTSLFAEVTYGYNWYNYEFDWLSTSGTSIGTNIGVRHQLTPDISFGGIAGLEWARTKVEKTYAYNTENNIFAYTRIGLFGAVTF